MSIFDGPATEVTVAGTSIQQHWWGLSYDKLGYLRAKHYPRAVSTAEVWDLVDRADDVGDTYPGSWGLFGSAHIWASYKREEGEQA